MKKIFISVLFVAIVFVFSGCADKSETSQKSLAVGKYVMEESDEVIKPNIQLQDDNKFIFNYSALSSYIAIGSYEVDDDSKLILKTDD